MSDVCIRPVEEDARVVQQIAAGPERTRGVPGLACILCGLGPVMAVEEAAAALGANRATVKYANSGDSPAGDRIHVVGYGAVVFWHSAEQR